MRCMILAAVLVPCWGALAGIAFAQEAPKSPAPEMQALQSVAMEAIQSRLNWQSQAIALQAQVADLQKKLDAAQAKPQETPK